MSNLKNQLVRLAHANPEIRKDLLPLITSSNDKVASASPSFDAGIHDDSISLTIYFPCAATRISTVQTIVKEISQHNKKLMATIVELLGMGRPYHEDDLSLKPDPTGAKDMLEAVTLNSVIYELEDLDPKKVKNSLEKAAKKHRYEIGEIYNW